MRENQRKKASKTFIKWNFVESIEQSIIIEQYPVT
jgi:hypothetical protein